MMAYSEPLGRWCNSYLLATEYLEWVAELAILNTKY